MSANRFHPWRLRAAVLLVSGGVAVPSIADTSAVYIQPASDNRIEVHYQSDERIRLDALVGSDPGTLLFLDGRTYMIRDREYVDLTAVRQIMNALSPKTPASGHVIEIERTEDQQTVAGHDGVVYDIRIGGQRATSTMSAAPELDELAQAFAIISQRLATLGALEDSLLQVLGDARFDRRAPIAFSNETQNYQVKRIGHESIEPEAFSIADLRPQEVSIPGLAPDDTELLMQRLRESRSDAEARDIIQQMLGR